MKQHINISQPSSQLLALALVASWLAITVQADSSLGTDAPGSSPNSGGPSTAYNDAGASGSNGGLSKTAQIAIGVVVGTIGLGAIIGGIVFFFRRKKKLDEKIKRYEAINAYHSAQSDAKQQQGMSLRQQRCQRQRERDVEQGMLEISTLPKDQTRDSVMPKYDPSSFHRHQYSLDSTRGLSIDMPREPLISHHQRQSSSISNNICISSMPPVPRLQKSASKRSKGTMGYNTQSSTENSGQLPNNLSALDQQSSSNNQTLKGPKKPKPALTRLITNL
ncbi:conserved hypothetical protein [Talaromyces stipitatus ATCC 10500]|uniref:Uncharacterized protein n=1 Tax=Talaromyces stipitatus (strain ATCC 10500 / CBS 375.48 / QM 6759 / NRRL 1006) TaxID=441959 RepID=B8MHU0_TALSN|nr:uncharacterized protein TSTA_015090 [Talaromyces stipitatus ATCC 10500]EED16420.1 conserved hypothetical protein [Talaromyces stipitatus ATCC 10500]